MGLVHRRCTRPQCRSVSVSSDAYFGDDSSWREPAPAKPVCVVGLVDCNLEPGKPHLVIVSHVLSVGQHLRFESGPQLCSDRDRGRATYASMLLSTRYGHKHGYRVINRANDRQSVIRTLTHDEGGRLDSDVRTGVVHDVAKAFPTQGQTLQATTQLALKAKCLRHLRPRALWIS